MQDKKVTACVLFGIIISSYAGSACTQIPASAESAQPSVTYRYIPAKTTKGMQAEARAKQGRLLENLSGTLSKGLVLPQQLTLALGECRQSNAFYDSRHRAVIVCYELIDDISDRVSRDFSSKGRQDLAREIGGGAFVFILFHELGHALIDLYKWPITGKEEDVADQFATYLILHTDQKSAFYGIQAAAWFNRKKEIFYSNRHFGDSHSLDPQRQFNVVCWAYGKDPQVYIRLAQQLHLPAQRAAGCRREYETMNGAITTLLKNNVGQR